MPPTFHTCRCWGCTHQCSACCTFSLLDLADHTRPPAHSPLRACVQVLDLDETLVHSSLQEEPESTPDFVFPVAFNGRDHMVQVRGVSTAYKRAFTCVCTSRLFPTRMLSHTGAVSANCLSLFRACISLLLSASPPLDAHTF